MLTEKQYEGIGRLTIAFNEIDAVVEAYLPLIAQFSKYALPTPHNVPRNFNGRAQALKMTLEAVSADDELAGAYAGGVLKLLDMATTLAAKRNKYVHAVALIDVVTNARTLKMRSGSVPPDEKQIFELAEEASFIASKLVEECEGLIGMYLTTDEDVTEVGLPQDWDEDTAE